jgi:hypothetical protein
MLSRYWLRGRRRQGRRHGERASIYVDRYSVREWGLVLAVLALSVLDLGLTIAHLDAGGSEANPLLAAVLAGGGLLAFVAAKLGLTLMALFVLLLHTRFPLGRLGLTIGFTLYASLMAWHGVVAAARDAATNADHPRATRRS